MAEATRQEAQEDYLGLSVLQSKVSVLIAVAMAFLMIFVI